MKGFEDCSTGKILGMEANGAIAHVVKVFASIRKTVAPGLNQVIKVSRESRVKGEKVWEGRVRYAVSFNGWIPFWQYL